MGLKFKIRIDAPPEKVFSCLGDLTRHSEFGHKSASLKVHKVSEGEPAIGSKYRSESLFMKKPVSADLTLTDYDPPSRVGFSVQHHAEGKKDVDYHQLYELASDGDGTLVQRTIGGGGAATYIFYPAVRADAMAALRNLKIAAEAKTN